MYKEYEILFQAFWIIIFSCVLALYQPFMKIYTMGIEDAQYVRPMLCFLCSLLGALWVIRNQQSVMIVAAGKFKEIQKGSIIEAVLTIVLSFAGLAVWGLEGLVAGRCIAAGYRVVDFIRFNSQNVVKVKIRFTVCQITISIVLVALIYLVAQKFLSVFMVGTYIGWAIDACIVASVAIMISIVFGLINWKNLSKFSQKIMRKNGK